MSLSDAPSREPRAQALIASIDSRAERRWVPFDSAGRRMCWRRFGDGPPLVLLHGGHGSWLHWVRNLDALSRHHTLWVPDMPGYGESDAPHGANTLPQMLGALSFAIDSLFGPDASLDLAGFSFGGLVAAHLAARNSRIRRLALLGAAGHGTPRRPKAALMSWKKAEADADQLRMLRHNLLAHMLHDEAQLDDLAFEVHVQSCHATRFHSRTISLSAPLLPALQAFHGPVLLIWGEHDVTATPGPAVAALLEGLAGRPPEMLRSTILTGGGHWIQFEQWQRVDALLAQWFGPAPLSADGPEPRG